MRASVLCRGVLPRSLFVLAWVALLFGCSGAKAPASKAPVDTTSAGPASASLPVTASPGAGERPEQANAKVPVTAADPQWGSVDAPVTIVECSHFQCPFCSRVVPTLEQLKQKYGPTQLRIVF